MERPKRSKVCLLKNLKAPSEATSALSRNRQDPSEKKKRDRSKTNRGGILKLLWRPGINSEELVRKFQGRAGIFKQSMGTRNRVGIGLLYRPARTRICKPFKEPEIDSQPGGPVRQPYSLYRLARLHRLAESLPELLKRLQIRAQVT